MNEPAVTLRRADAETLAVVETLLEENELPSADVRSNPKRFYVGYDGDDRIGVGGVERYGTAGLLRSVVVERSARGGGYGTALCAALESAARDEGVETLYLLTTTAAGFFASQGYAEIERTEPPTAVRETAQFGELCPATATCMRKRL
ncbi:arsenic resistance N-acetyltransferase ArsN2 [Natronococcus wangiae]|uniref:arsenic resistance N-acetyltransferase ArsN2 n=1 Tax=Natronococcus wangiae TaxID=3068275 RepID=UPI00273F073E|nr:arsenic resistance N-acetyltransferase ArsN2 [Natronococcus sp. AD5]